MLVGAGLCVKELDLVRCLMRGLSVGDGWKNAGLLPSHSRGGYLFVFSLHEGRAGSSQSPM